MRHYSKIGIYLIEGPGPRHYVGQSVHLKERRHYHFTSLRRGTHENEKLQHAWNKHGERAFIWRVLLHCAAENLELFEQRAMASFDAVRSGYNIAPSAQSRRGLKNPHVAARNRAQRGSDHPSYGKKRPDLSARNSASKGKPGKPKGLFTPAHCEAISRGKKKFFEEKRRPLEESPDVGSSGIPPGHAG